MVLSLDTDVATAPDPTSGVAASTAVSLPSSKSKSKPEDDTAVSLTSSHSKPEDTAIWSGMIININKVINLFIRYKT